LERHGWQLKRIKGSHHIYDKSGHRAEHPCLYMVIPLKLDLLKALMKIAGLTEDDL